MSTKIYEGFKLADKWNDGKIETFEKFCNEVKEIVQRLYANEWIKSFNRLSVYQHLNAIRNNKEYCHLDTELYMKNTYEIPEIAFFFFEGKVYGSTFLDNYGIRKTLIEKGYIKDFAYWDNTDPDEEVSEEEWNERQRVWDSIDHWQVSITFQDYMMRSNYYLTDDDRKEIKELIPLLEEKGIETWLIEEMERHVRISPYFSKDCNPWILAQEIIKNDNYDGPLSSIKEDLLEVIEKYKQEKSK